jgi:murein DD-endopeptidase MepM/ murein hydrolase activator NlpD
VACGFAVLAATAGAGLLPGAARASSGGARVAPAPRIDDARCRATAERRCVGAHWVQPGGSVEITGRYLGAATTVVFYGRGDASDNVTGPATARRSGKVIARVPPNAHSGPIAVATETGVLSRRWSGLVVDEPPASSPRKVFYGGIQEADFAYQVTGTAPVDVTVNLVRLAGRKVVRTWRQTQVQPGVPQKVVWNGMAAGRVQPEGYYAFEVVDTSASGSSAARAADGEQDSFAFHGHMFPVRGRHDYGGAGARFGAGRGGRSHQGHDVFASCGTPLVAARAGKVVYAGFHRLAGYYLVVEGRGSGQDYVYMHLRGPALVKSGESVYTGQQVGEVGDSGNAHGCHLHFELWSAPGWYRGGRPSDPLPELRRWDQAS